MAVEVARPADTDRSLEPLMSAVANDGGCISRSWHSRCPDDEQHRQPHTERERERERQRETERERETERDRDRDRETERQRDREI